MTTMTRLRPLALDPQRIHRGEVGPGKYDIDAAMSADGYWLFHYSIAAGARGEYLPTGDLVTGRTLRAVRLKAARPGVIDRFRARAVAELAELGPFCQAAGRPGVDVRAVVVDLALYRGDRDELAQRWALARRRLGILEGRMVAAYEFDGVCACGGYLVGDLHGDGCSECLDGNPSQRIRCRLLAQHQACATPDPVLCDHGCARRAQPVPCWRGRDFCCGCCDDGPAAGAGMSWAVPGTVRPGDVTGVDA